MGVQEEMICNLYDHTEKEHIGDEEPFSCAWYCAPLMAHLEKIILMNKMQI